MPSEPKGAVTVIEKKFDYSPLDRKVAEQVQNAAQRIRQSVKRTMESIIAVGTDLLRVKDALPHGDFTKWLHAEFGWTERTARNFMAVSEAFGKPEIVSDLKIDPTAAYLLAAPSAPDEAREAAIERAQAGERVTTTVAKDILLRTRKRMYVRRRKTFSAAKQGERLMKNLERFRDNLQPDEITDLIKRLQAFVAILQASDKSEEKPKPHSPQSRNSSARKR